jgi:hypothetical protein
VNPEPKPETVEPVKSDVITPEEQRLIDDMAKDDRKTVAN